MSELTAGKIAQARALVAASDVDVWLTFVRETAEGTDPVLPLLIEGGLTWQSALMIGRRGERIAIVGNYDADALAASGDWDPVIPYVEGIRAPLIGALERLAPDASRRPRVAVNWSLDDPKSDGITHGMVRLLERMLHGTRFEGSLVSAEEIVRTLRSRKTPDEIQRIRGAVRATEEILSGISRVAGIGRTERDVFDSLQGIVRERGLGLSWDPRSDPIVNSGPDSMVGHGLASAEIRIAPGHLFHVDFGVLVQGYASDLQRTWYVPAAGAPGIPSDVLRAFRAVHGAISAGADALRPGALGWQVDEAARRALTSAGYPEYAHALGHQVGRMAHDGGAILGPLWERYGRTPRLAIEPDQVYTLELGVDVKGRGYLGIEEMVLVTATGCEFLSARQEEIAILA